jgi:hypothetical protein
VREGETTAAPLALRPFRLAAGEGS